MNKKITITQVENGYLVDINDQVGHRSFVYTEFEGLVNELGFRFSELNIGEIFKLVKERE